MSGNNTTFGSGVFETLLNESVLTRIEICLSKPEDVYELRCDGWCRKYVRLLVTPSIHLVFTSMRENQGFAFLSKAHFFLHFCEPQYLNLKWNFLNIPDMQSKEAKRHTRGWRPAWKCQVEQDSHSWDSACLKSWALLPEPCPWTHLLTPNLMTPDTYNLTHQHQLIPINWAVCEQVEKDLASNRNTIWSNQFVSLARQGCHDRHTTQDSANRTHCGPVAVIPIEWQCNCDGTLTL